MKILQINTTQNVNVDFELANIGQRLLAFIADNVIKFIYLYLIIQVFNFTIFNEYSGGDYWSIRALDVLMFLPITFYSLYSEIILNGQTIGKKLMKIRVINSDGFKPSLIDYSIRWFLRMADFNLFALLMVYVVSLELSNNIGVIYAIFIFGKLVGFTSILITKNNQRLGDISANTIVISLKDTTEFSHTIFENLSETYKPTYPSVMKLSDNDARIIKDTFKIAKKTGNYKTLIKLRFKIEEVTGIKSQEKSDMSFIDIVLKDYNFYTRQ